MLYSFANATTLSKNCSSGSAGTGFPGKFKISSFARFATSSGMVDKSGKNPFSARNGISYGTAPASLIPASYATYAGFVVKTMSPSLQKASGKWTKPSWEPIV